MLFGRSIIITTHESPETLITRLSATVLSTEAITPLCPRPNRVTDWLSHFKGKRFVGSIEGQRFKLGLLQAPSIGGLRYRGSVVVVIIGSIESQLLKIQLRPPLFMLAFLGFFTVAMSAGLVLSFFRATNAPVVHLLLAFGLVSPIAIVVWFFRREATEAEQVLRQVISGSPASSQP
jgi:hypothetical protein